jgi:hypothetical protein
MVLQETKQDSQKFHVTSIKNSLSQLGINSKQFKMKYSVLTSILATDCMQIKCGIA